LDFVPSLGCYERWAREAQGKDVPVARIGK
jgi:hypothetical protein